VSGPPDAQSRMRNGSAKEVNGMSQKAKCLIAAALATVSIAAVPTVQAITASPGVALACSGGGGGCE
jgi:hypothetical protein